MHRCEMPLQQIQLNQDAFSIDGLQQRGAGFLKRSGLRNRISGAQFVIIVFLSYVSDCSLQNEFLEARSQFGFGLGGSRPHFGSPNLNFRTSGAPFRRPRGLSLPLQASKPHGASARYGKHKEMLTCTRVGCGLLLF